MVSTEEHHKRRGYSLTNRDLKQVRPIVCGDDEGIRSAGELNDRLHPEPDAPDPEVF